MTESTNLEYGDIERPVEVTGSIWLIYASLAIGILRTILDFNYIISRAPVLFALLLFVFIIGFILFLTDKISRGRNWARLTFLILFLLGLLPAISSYVNDFRRSLPVGVIGIIQAVMQAVALYLLFSKPANSWFRLRKAVLDAPRG